MRTRIGSDREEVHMANVKVGSTTYTGVNTLELINASTNDSVSFAEADDFMEIMAGGSGYDYYENSQLTSISQWATHWFFSRFTTVYLPNVTTLAQNNANHLNCENFIAPKLTSVANQLTNGGAGKCKIVDIGALTEIGTYGFSGGGLTTIILRGNTVPSCSSVNNQKAGVTVYVPSAMLSSYQADTTWQSLVSSKNWTLTALEGSQYEDTDWFKS